MNLKAKYEVKDIAALLGYDWSVPRDRDRCRRFVRKLKVVRQPGGPRSKLYVYLGDLRAADPALWESIRDKAALAA